MKTLFAIAFLLGLIFPTLAYSEIYKCIIDGHTTYSPKECPPPILDPVATKKLNDEAASHGFSGFLDTSKGKQLTCAEAAAFNGSHDTSKTMAACKIDGKLLRERAHQKGRDQTTGNPWIDGCVEGSCKVGVWRDVSYSRQ